MAYIAPKMNWTPTDAIHASDMNRVEGNIDHVFRNAGGGGDVFRYRAIPMPYTATEDVTSFPIPELIESNIVNLILENLTPVYGSEFTVDYETKMVNLTFTLEAGQTIYYELSVDASALVAPGDNGYISIGDSQIKVYDIAEDLSTSLTETQAGKAADATVAKALNDKIGTVSTDLGNKAALTTTNKTSAVLAINEVRSGAIKYLGEFAIDEDSNNLKSREGKLAFGKGTNLPSQYGSFYDFHTGLYGGQLFFQPGNSSMLFRLDNNGNYSAWQTVATNNNVPIYLGGWVAGQTALEFANSVNRGIRFIAGSGAPSDLPIQTEGWVEVISDGGPRKQVRFTVYGINSRTYYKNIFNGDWYGSDWKEIATTGKTDIAFPYATGYTDFSTTLTSKITKNSLNEVKLKIQVKPTSGSFTQNTWIAIGTLPLGYRPSERTPILFSGEVNALTPSFVVGEINTNGSVQAYITTANVTLMRGSTIFDV